jgi:glycosyltransferase involved in cell wall biosynthesis
MTLVSVIINCHNGRRYLREALDSVYAQTFKDWEIVFWDNLSTDDSGEIARSYRGPLRYFRGESFLPLGAARNAAIAEARGKYVAFLDGDDTWAPEKLKCQVALLERGSALVYADCNLIDASGAIRQDTYWTAGRPARGRALNELLEINFIPMPTAVVSREALNEVGPFQPGYEMAEEYELWLRIAARYPIDYVAAPLASYRVYDQSTSGRNAARLYREVIEILGRWRAESGSGVDTAAIKYRQARLYLALIKQHLKESHFASCFGETAGYLKLFPQNLEILPSLVLEGGSPHHKG